MPTYIYRCKNKHQFEIIRRITDHKAIERCNQCSEDAYQVHNNDRNGGIQFNTTGFYNTDFKDHK